MASMLPSTELTIDWVNQNVDLNVPQGLARPRLFMIGPAGKLEIVATDDGIYQIPLYHLGMQAVGDHQHAERTKSGHADESILGNRPGHFTDRSQAVGGLKTGRQTSKSMANAPLVHDRTLTLKDDITNFSSLQGERFDMNIQINDGNWPPLRLLNRLNAKEQEQYRKAYNFIMAFEATNREIPGFRRDGRVDDDWRFEHLITDMAVEAKGNINSTKSLRVKWVQERKIMRQLVQIHNYRSDDGQAQRYNEDDLTDHRKFEQPENEKKYEKMRKPGKSEVGKGKH